MANFDSITNGKNKKWPYIPDHSYIILMIGGSKSAKINALINLINEQNNIFFIKKRENAGIKYYNDPNVFIECSSTMDDIHENIDDYNSNRKRKILIVFDDMIADIMTNKKFHAKIEELFERCRKLNISLVFIAQPCFAFLKDVRLNFV